MPCYQSTDLTVLSLHCNALLSVYQHNSTLIISHMPYYLYTNSTVLLLYHTCLTISIPTQQYSYYITHALLSVYQLNSTLIISHMPYYLYTNSTVLLLYHTCLTISIPTQQYSYYITHALLSVYQLNSTLIISHMPYYQYTNSTVLSLYQLIFPFQSALIITHKNSLYQRPLKHLV